MVVVSRLRLNGVLDTAGALIVHSAGEKLSKHFSNISNNEELSERLLSDDER